MKLSTALSIVVIYGATAVVIAQQNNRGSLVLNRYTTTPRSLRPRNLVASSNVQPASRFSTRSDASAQSTIVPQNDAQLSQAVADLALSIGQNLDETYGAAEIFSPVSIMGAINMLLVAADGITRAELLGALRLGEKTKMNEYHRRAAAVQKNLLVQNPQDLGQLPWKGASCVTYDDDEEQDDPIVLKPKELRIANAIFAQHNLPISEKFVSLTSQLYGASTQKVNFRDSLSASAIVNKWVSQVTNGRIREVTNGQFSTETNMIIASSLYFKASWQNEFAARSTRPKDFYPEGAGRPSVMVDTMTMSACLPFLFDRELGVRMIGLPYSDNATTMYVILPLNSTRSKIRSVQKQLTATRIDSMISKMNRRSTNLNFPRMQLVSSTNLEKPFHRLGIKSIFNPQQSNLRQMLDQSAQGKVPLFVSQINHKVNLDVDEKGTEGAAVTITLVDRSATSVFFNVNEPFLIYIRHDPTRIPLFYGAVFDPRG